MLKEKRVIQLIKKKLKKQHEITTARMVIDSDAAIQDVDVKKLQQLLGF